MQKMKKAGGTYYRVLLVLFFLKVNMIGMAQVTEAPDMNMRVTISAVNQPFKLILKQITRQTGFNFIFPENQLDPNELYTIQAKKETVKEVLTSLVSKKGFGWIADANVITFYKSSTQATNTLPAQNVPESEKKVIIRGYVMDNITNEPLEGATVILNGTSTGTTTDKTGRFILTHSKVKKQVLLISYTGYVRKEVPVNAGDSVIQAGLQQAVNTLDETVAIAYGSTSRRFNTGDVSKISEIEIGNQPVTNMLAALQGRVPGLTITQSSGIAGTSFTTQIRGRNSLFNGSEPLFIIDGVPITPNNKKTDKITSIATQNFDEGGISPFNGINPADITSIEVLKDADATAIYGSRGANGVILITTKRGKAGQTIFSANVSTGIGMVAHMEPLLTTSQYLQMRKEAFANDGITPTSVAGTTGYAPDLMLWDQKRSVDWQKFLIGGTAHTTDANGSISGGTVNTQFFASAGYHRETSVFPADMAYNRGTFNFSLNHKSADKKFTLDFNVKYSTDQNRLYKATLLSILLPPNAPVLHDDAGNLNWEENGAPFANPLADFLRKYQIQTDNVLSNFKVGYRLADGLTFRSGFGFNWFKTNENSQEPIAAQNPVLNPSSTGSATFATGDIKSFIVEPQLDYTKIFSAGTLSALLGGSWQYSKNETNSTSAEGYTNDALLNSLEDAGEITDKLYDNTKYKYVALFGRLIYNYKGKYIINGSARRDGSSRFGPDKRYNDFGAVGAAWIFTNEAFARQIFTFLDFGKIRGSYGVTGNDQIGDYRYLNTWSSTGVSPYQGILSLQADGLYNPAFSWERNKKLEAAIELGFFHNRLFTTVNYFRNRSDNQLVEYKLPAQTGFMNIIKNIPALIQNKGWELDLTADIIKRKDFNWTLSGNLTVPANKLVRYPGIENSTYSSIYAIGYSVNVLRRYHSSGIDKNTGLFTFEDVDKSNTLTAIDYRVVGKLDPKYYGGINNSFQYHEFRLDFLLEFKNKMAPNYFYSIYLNTLTPGLPNNQTTAVLDRWQKSGDVTNVQKFAASTGSPAYALNKNVAYSDAAFSSGTYMRLKNAAVTYSMKKETVSKLKLQNLRVYIQGQNLLTFTKYKGFDPETPYYFSLPPLRVIKVGLQIGL
jgi:TonB-linked SusC/RagA family outer membrane protein